MKQKSVFLPKDSLGRPVHAHGGQILLHQGMYYWIGEDRTGRNRVSCYRSANLRDWEFRNHILTVDSLGKTAPANAHGLAPLRGGRGLQHRASQSAVL